MYERGNGVPQNADTSKGFYGAGCDLGNTEACFAYDDLSSRVPPAENLSVSEKESGPASPDEGANASSVSEKAAGEKVQNAEEIMTERRDGVSSEENRIKDGNAERNNNATVSLISPVSGSGDRVSGNTNGDNAPAGGSVPQNDKKVKKSGKVKKGDTVRKTVRKHKT